MTTRTIRTADEAQAAAMLVQNHALPFTMTVAKGAKRTLPQNNLQHKWFAEAAEQLCDESAADKRAFCKLTIGVPILYVENDEWRDQYKALIKPLPYEAKLAMMKPPLDFPVTSRMTVKQKTAFLDAVRQHYAAQGVNLTIPESER